MVCANCHRKLELGIITVPSNAKRIYKKKSNKVETIKPKYDLCSCGNKKCVKSTLCRKCNDTRPKPEKRKADRPDYNTLMIELDESSYCAVARKYGVSDNAVRKWVRTYEKELGV